MSDAGFTVVIGGGGAMAIGISAGIMLALREVGLDCAEAETCIGTSAGAAVAADLRLGRDLHDIAAQVCSDAEDADPVQTLRAWETWPELGRRAVGSSWVLLRALSPVRVALAEPPRALQRWFPGSLVTLGESQDWAAERYPQEWPDGRLWLIASNLDTGHRAILEADPPAGRPVATLPEALQASCAIPGLYPPVRLGGVRLVDGGVRSATNFDLAGKAPSRAVVCITSISSDPADPPTGASRLLRSVPNRQALREVAQLRRQGHDVLLLRPGRDALELAGSSVFSGRITSDVVEAAYEGATRRLAMADMQRRLERMLDAAERPAQAPV